MPKKITQNVNKDKLFNDLPKVVPFTSKWGTRFANYQSCNVGQIVPIYCDEVLADEKRKITMGMVSHTTTPVAPIFNSLYTEIRSFFVPFRLCADLLNGYKTRKSPWVKVFGEDNASTSADIIVPLANQKLPDFSSSHQFIIDVSNYVTAAASGGSRDNVFDSLDYFTTSKSFLAKMNFLSLAAYELVYQRHYRNENYEAATLSPLYRLLYDAYNSSKASVSLGATFTFEFANREKDYFTGMKPFTQKGDAINVSIGGSAKLGITDTPYKFVPDTKQGKLYASASGVPTSGLTEGDPLSSSDRILMADGNGSTVNMTNIVVDLTTAKGVSVEELRLLIKTQELLEKDALYGSRYAESLNAHFGCCPLDLTLQDPQELYKTTITSQMQAIFQTSTTSGEASILGTIGANSTTQTDPFVILPETKFKEHGFIIICAVHKLQNVYSGAFFKRKYNFKKARFDFYTPELNDLGYQPVTQDEMRASSNVVAGYNEAFAEYRYKFNSVHGELWENFKYWSPAIGNEYSTAAALYKEDPVILDKALSVKSTNAPQFYDAWGFEEENTKPMSLHSIPGMDGVI